MSTRATKAEVMGPSGKRLEKITGERENANKETSEAKCLEGLPHGVRGVTSVSMIGNNIVFDIVA